MAIFKINDKYFTIMCHEISIAQQGIKILNLKFKF